LPVALSREGGLNFHLVANIPGIGKRNGKGSGEKGLFRFVDQPDGALHQLDVYTAAVQAP
jgi:hypothetical protein